ncbi:RNA-directed DNA polymerase from mobile element jockey [Lucilia cuprina]|nr:RNA-directed DNA polymerase from mobile element jockey [Lucilia cuprina]
MIIRRFKRNAHSLIFDNKDSKQIWSILKGNGVVDNVNNYDSIDPDYLNNVFSSNQSTGNDIIDTSVYSYVARIVLLNKNSGINDGNDFRPISMLPILSKMVEHLIKFQLVKHIDDGRLLHDCQTGFRCNRNTTSLLLGLTDNIRRCGNRGNCVLLSLDLAKAFYRVNHSILVEKLHSRISSNICLPFSFADDVQLLFRGDVEFPDVLQSVIDHTADLLFSWVQDNDLSVNVSKTKAMLFGICGNNNNFSVTLGNNMIEFVGKLKCLGVILDRELNFEGHVNSVVSRVNFTLRKLYSLDYIKKRVVHGLIMPIFLYALEVYSGTFGYVIKRRMKQQQHSDCV